MNYIDIGKIFNNKTIPIWLMRQAGRYLPEYREVRKNIGSFLELCYNTNLITTVTIQPINRFDLDAAIIFSDILVVPHALGINVKFEKDYGPKLDKIKTAAEIEKITPEKFIAHLNPVYEGIEKTKSLLPKGKPLIGFIGAPWTLATYMIEGGGSKNFNEVKELAYVNEIEFSKIINILIEFSALHLIKQIEAGVDVVQIFDSWAGVLDESNFMKWVIEPTAKIVKIVRAKYPNIPIIGFPRGAGVFYKDYVEKVKIDIVSVDNNLPRDLAKTLLPKITIQGNLDPIYLLTSKKQQLVTEIKNVLECFKNHNHIFNLGHGILPNTPIENVNTLIATVREYEKEKRRNIV